MPLTATPATYVRTTDTGDHPDTQLYRHVLDTLQAAGLCPHHRPSTDDTWLATLNAVPAASDLATSKTLTLALYTALYDTGGHFGDTTAHDAADPIADPAAFTSLPAEPADLAEVGATLNEMKADCIAHQASTTFHANGVGGEGGVTPTIITTADYATLQAEANALANALVAWINKHAGQGMPEVTDPQ